MSKTYTLYKCPDYSHLDLPELKRDKKRQHKHNKHFKKKSYHYSPADSFGFY